MPKQIEPMIVIVGVAVLLAWLFVILPMVFYSH
jgi:hypothetical protein